MVGLALGGATASKAGGHTREGGDMARRKVTKDVVAFDLETVRKVKRLLNRSVRELERVEKFMLKVRKSEEQGKAGKVKQAGELYTLGPCAHCKGPLRRVDAESARCGRCGLGASV